MELAAWSATYVVILSSAECAVDTSVKILTGIFAQKSIAAYDPTAREIKGGWLDRHFGTLPLFVEKHQSSIVIVQLGYQLAASLAGMAWAFALTVR